MAHCVVANGRHSRPLNSVVRAHMIAIRTRRTIKSVAIAIACWLALVAALASMSTGDQRSFWAAFTYWLWTLPLVLASGFLRRPRERGFSRVRSSSVCPVRRACLRSLSALSSASEQQSLQSTCGEHMRSNNALERTENHHGALCRCEWASFPAAQLGR
jgi:hypothetical protein